MKNGSKPRGPTLVGDVMTAPAITIQETTKFNDIVVLLDANGISSVPVINEAQHLIGLVSEADLLLKQNAGPRARGVFDAERNEARQPQAEGAVAQDLMSRAVVTAEADDPIALVARQMYERRLKSMPVVRRDGTVLGVIARRDVLRAFVRSDAEIQADVTAWLRRFRRSSSSSVRVAVHKGVVTLTGAAVNPTDAELFGALAGGVEGVVAVQSQLHILGDEDRAEADVSATGAWAEA